MITHTNQSRYHELLFVIIAFLLITVPLSANAVSTEGVKVARSKCTSVEQEIIDFETLEKQVTKTNAIGVMTKLKLKSDINKLLSELKTFHAGNSPLTQEQHREQYDLLYMKVVSLVHEKDPELYHQLCNAWDPIWATLRDEHNLQKVSRVFSLGSMAIAKITDVIMIFISASISTVNAEEKLLHDETVKHDLFIVITLHGAHCKAVVDYEKFSDQDYVAVCENGNQYRVHVSADGKVNMAPHKQ
jgi:hypothetical protein